MGAGDSKSKKNKKGSDDGCIVNRRVRTIILSILLIVFGLFAIAYVFAMQETYADLKDSLFGSTDYAEDKYNAWNCIAAGIFIVIVGAICAIILFFIPNCDDKLGRVAGLILIIGGVLYLIGWIIEVNSSKDVHIGWDLYTDEVKQQLTAQWWAQIGEALLFSVAAILLGIDALLQWFDDEAKRLSSNLGLLMVVSALTMNAYFLQICPEDDTDSLFAVVCVTPDGVEWIATGYAILFVACLVFIILYICTCCTCNCKDNCLVRVALAVALVIGGVLCSIGYYVHVGGSEDANTDDIYGKYIAFYLGYTALIGGFPIVWALDIALDDVKNSK